jgi:hypothetical protein
MDVGGKYGQLSFKHEVHYNQAISESESDKRPCWTVPTVRMEPRGYVIRGGGASLERLRQTVHNFSTFTCFQYLILSTEEIATKHPNIFFDDV